MPFRNGGGITKAQVQELVGEAEGRIQPVLTQMLEAINTLAKNQEATNNRLDRLEGAVDRRLASMDDRLGRIEELLRNGR